MHTRGRFRPLVVVLGAVATALVARRWLDVVEVRGGSMAPTLLPGDRLLVVRARRAPRVGDVVLALDPRDPRRELVKRVAAANERGIALAGDDPARSTDARTFGTIPAASVHWRVVGRIWPRPRAGRIGGPPPPREERLVSG